MTDNEFDDILKSRLQHYSSEVPDDMWQRINGKQKRRRAVYWWYSLTATLLLILIVAGVRILTNKEKSKIKTSYSKYSITDSTIDKNKIVRDSAKAHFIPEIYKASLFNNDFKIAQRNKTSPVIKRMYVQQLSSSDKNNYAKDVYRQHKLHQTDSSENFENKETVKENIGDSGTRKRNQEISPAYKNDSNETNKSFDKFTLNAFASADAPFTNVHANDADYQQLLRNSFKMKLSFTLGLGVNYAVSKKISLSTGVQYTRVNERITDTLRFKNRLTFINVPLLLTYKKQIKGDISMAVKAGVLLNITSNYKGVIPLTSGGFDDIKNNVYKKNTGVSLYGGIQLSKPVSNRFAIYAEPDFRYQLNNMANNNQSFSRKIHAAGFAAGIQYNLFKSKQ